jgi:hypothetical protein
MGNKTLLSSTLSSRFGGGRDWRPPLPSIQFCQIAFLSFLFADTSWASPVIFNQPFTAKPGDVVNLLGSGFGALPKVTFKAAHRSTAMQVKILRADNNLIAFEMPKDQPFDIYTISVSDGATASATVSINTPRAMHFDTPEIGSQNIFRIFGHNLYVQPGLARV